MSSRITQPSRHLPLLVGLGAVLAVAAWLLAGGDDPDAAPVQVVEGPRAPVEAPQSAGRDGQPPVAGAAAIEVVVLATLAPPAPRAARLVDRGVAVDETVEVLAGPGTADPASRSGPHLLRFTLVDGSQLLRVAHLSPTATVEVPRLAPRRLAGRVADADGQPLAGEIVWAGGWWNDGARVEVVTDAAGRFEFEAVPTGPGVVVLAGGGERFAPAWRLIDPAPDAPVDGLVVTLQPRAELAVNLLAQVDEPWRGRVWLRPADASTATTGFPFFLAGLDGEDGFALDASGEALVPVPGGDARVDVVVGHPALLLADRAGVRLGTRERPRARVAADGGAALAITVLGLDGAPRAGVGVEVGPLGGAPVRAPGALLPYAAQTGAWSFGTSGADGRVVLRRPAGQPAQVTLRTAVTSHWPVAADQAQLEVFAVSADDVEPLAGSAPALILANPGATPREVRAPGRGPAALPADGVLEIPLERPALLALRQVDADGAVVVVARVPVLGTVHLPLPD